jgi:hypothetical protein
MTPIELLQSNICKMAGVMMSVEESRDEHHDFPNLPNAHVISYGPVILAASAHQLDLQPHKGDMHDTCMTCERLVPDVMTCFFTGVT